MSVALQDKTDSATYPLISLVLSVLEFLEEIFVVFGVSIEDVVKFRIGAPKENEVCLLKSILSRRELIVR
jgi:hypothetical protein